VKETVLAVAGLTVYRDNYAAVEDVSFSLKEGQIRRLLDPMAQGKVRWFRQFWEF
jgi:zinc transport system ATP-binding protein